MKTLNPKKPHPRCGLARILTGTVFCALLSTADAQTLAHRWSFNDASDSVGSASVSLAGSASISGGALNVFGAPNAGDYGAVDISSDFTNYTSTTIEGWFTETVIQDWSKAWMFGNGGVNANAGTTYLDFTPNRGATQSPGISITPAPFGGGDFAVAGPAQLAEGVEHHAVAVYDYSANKMTLYIDGAFNCSGSMQNTPISALVATQFRFGAGTSWPDASMNGSINEMRVYNGPLTPAQVEANYEAGPDSIAGSPGALAAIQFNNTASIVVGGKFPPAILATYAALTNKVNITGVSGITYSSDDPNVVSFGTDGLFHAETLGTTTIRATYQSQTATLAVTVGLEPAVLAHRYSFNGAVESTAITDSVGSAHGTLINQTESAALTGSGQLNLDGNASSAYVALPSGLMATLTNATFQVWVNNHDPFSDWAELWTFGTNNGAQGLRYIALIPNNPATGKLRFDFNTSGGAFFDAPGPLPLNQDSCVTVTYNYSAQSASIYVDGRKVATTTMTQPLYTLPDGNNYIGQSQWYGSGDPYFNGTLDEFRIYSGVKSDLQIAIDAATGPDSIVTDPGALVSLSVLTSSPNVDVHGAGVPIQVLANFANVTGVDVTTLAETTLTSGNLLVGTIVNGNFTPQNVGAATVTASYGNVSGSVNLTVVDSEAWPTLLHRYTFNETSGTTLNDTVGNIHGTIYGPVTLTGQQLVMPAGNPAPGGDGLPTAASGWVSFPAGEGLITGLPNAASIETWVVWQGGAVWQEMYDFGQAATPGISLGGGNYLMVSPHDGISGALRLEWFPGGLVLTGPSLQEGQLSQVVVAHDQDRQLDKLYLNGQLMASGHNDRLWSSLSDVDNWLARDQWPDAMFNGAYADMRIWNGALTAGQVANLYAAGPDTIAGPALQIAATGSQVTLQWPANATGFSLQSTTSLTGGTWGNVTTTPTVVNGLNVLTLPATQTQTYYRLKQ